MWLSLNLSHPLLRILVPLSVIKQAMLISTHHSPWWTNIRVGCSTAAAKWLKISSELAHWGPALEKWGRPDSWCWPRHQCKKAEFQHPSGPFCEVLVQVLGISSLEWCVFVGIAHARVHNMFIDISGMTRIHRRNHVTCICICIMYIYIYFLLHYIIDSFFKHAH